MSSSNKERAIVLIDGRNFYHKLKDLGLQTLTFDYAAFSLLLAGHRQMVRRTYYVGEVRTDGTAHAQKLYNNQQKLIAHLKVCGFRYQFGYLLKSDGVFHEKGVDVHMAVDLLVAAYENLCERIYLVSSDTDLIPAIQKAQTKGKMVAYVGFSHHVSLAMTRVCKETKTFTRDDLLPFIPSRLLMRKRVA